LRRDSLIFSVLHGRLQSPSFRSFECTCVGYDPGSAVSCKSSRKLPPCARPNGYETPVGTRCAAQHPWSGRHGFRTGGCIMFLERSLKLRRERGQSNRITSGKGWCRKRGLNSRPLRYQGRCHTSPSSTPSRDHYWHDSAEPEVGERRQRSSNRIGDVGGRKVRVVLLRHAGV
jgi:hypothetical protein